MSNDVKLTRRHGLTLGAGFLGAGLIGIPTMSHAKDMIKVAAIFSTPIEEPWDGVVHAALKAEEAAGNIKYQFSENVRASDVGRVLKEYAEEGTQIITGDCYTSERIARKLAKNYPDIAFLMGSGAGPAEPNFSVFDNWIYEPAYLSGMIAGKMTKTNKIGAVYAMPIPEVNRLVNAFFAGARSVNPDIKQSVASIGSFFDPLKAKEAALAQCDGGVDVIYAERFGVIEAAKARGIYAFSNMSDQSSLAPDTVITGPVWNMTPTIQQALKLVRAGLFSGQDYKDFSQMSKGGASLAPYHDFANKLPKDLIALVAKRQEEIIDGDFRVDIDEATPIAS